MLLWSAFSFIFRSFPFPRKRGEKKKPSRVPKVTLSLRHVSQKKTKMSFQKETVHGKCSFLDTVARSSIARTPFRRENTEIPQCQYMKVRKTCFHSGVVFFFFSLPLFFFVVVFPSVIIARSKTASRWFQRRMPCLAKMRRCGPKVGMHLSVRLAEIARLKDVARNL